MSTAGSSGRRCRARPLRRRRTNRSASREGTWKGQTMRHLKSGSKLGRNPWHRRATLRNLVTNLFEHGRITTTLTRAKATRRVGDGAKVAILELVGYEFKKKEKKEKTNKQEPVEAAS